MAITLRTNQMKIKNNSSYMSLDVISDATTEERIETINNAATTQLNAIDAKAAQALASISDISELEGMISGVFNAANNYTAGQYVIQEVSGTNKLYRFTADYTANDGWSNAQVVEVKVGNEMTDLKSAFEDITGNIPIPMVAGKYINLSGASVSMSDGVPQYSSGTTVYSCGMMRCSEGDAFTISGTGGSSTRQWGFIDSSGTILNVSDANVTNNKLEIVAPTNAEWIIIHTNDGRASFIDILENHKIDDIGEWYNVPILSSYKGSYTSGKVDRESSLLTVYAECHESVLYKVTKTATKRFSVFFTSNPPIIGEELIEKKIDRNASEILARSPAGANFICAYVYNENTDSSFGTMEQIEASVIIEAKSAQDCDARDKATNNAKNVDIINQKNVSVNWDVGGIGADGAFQTGINRLRTIDFIDGYDVTINIDPTIGMYSLRYYHDDTFLSSDTSWRSAKLVDAFSHVEGCNRIKVVLKYADNRSIYPADFDALTGAVTITRTTVLAELHTLAENKSNLPKSYYVSEISATAESIKDLQTEPCVTFAFVTDIHYKSVNGSSEGECLNPDLFDDCIVNMRNLLEQCKVDFVFCNGDFTDGLVAKETTKAYVKHMMDGFRQLPAPFACSIGNHDDNRYSPPMMTSTEIFANYSSQGNIAKIHYGNMNGTNYYFDYENLGIRFIVINSNNSSGGYDFTEDTRSFLTSALAGMPEGYQGFLFVHTSPGTVMNYNQTVRPHGSDVEAIINNSGRMCAMFYGHSHQDNSFGPSGSGALNTYDYLAICTCCEKCTNSNGDPSKWSPNASMPTREVGTYTEDLWDIVVIRPASRKINFVRFGAGSNREFSY